MGKKILLVEDDPIARRSLERVISSHPRLAPLKPTVVQAASGQQGLAVFVSERPDLIITDLFMPAMDGFTFCRSLREAPFGKDVPIIVTSGIYKDPALASSLSDEVQALFLPKPLQTDDLVLMILSCLGEPPLEQAAEPAGSPNDIHLRPTTPRPVALDLADFAGLADIAHPAHPAHPAHLAPSRPTPERDAAPAVEPPTQAAGEEASYAGDHANPGVGAGDLADTHVAQLIFDLADTDLTGTLSLAHGKVKKDLYVRHGKVVAADSNLRQEALGTLLCAKGVIDEGQLTYLLAETRARRHKMGAVLIELGWLSPEEVLQALAAQARKRITDCLRWDAGTFAFTPGDTFGDRIIEHDLDATSAVFLGLYRSATPESLVERFDQNGACPVQLTQRFDRYREQFAAVFGGDIALLLADAPSIGALSLREDAHVVMAQVDALIETGLATLAGPADEATSLPPSIETSFSLERLSADLSRRFEAIVQPSTAMSFSDLRRGDSRPVAPGSIYSHAADEASSGALDIGYQMAAAKTAGSPPTAVADLRQAVLHEYLMIHGKSHYDILGVAANAPASEIERAVRAKLVRYATDPAPDGEDSPSDAARLRAVRNAITQAGHILCDPVQRKEYDRSLLAAQSAPADPLGAELAFGEGLQAFQAERFDEALARFETAVAARPDQAVYHAYLGWTDFVAHGPDRATDARDRLQHALVLDPDLAEAHAMLGRMAATEDDAGTARRHLEQTLTLEPDQPDIVDLLIEAYARLPEPDPRGAERFLRRLVGSLGERAEPLRKRLWLELGDLYENKLGDRGSARIAYDSAARLGPKNIDTLRKSQELNAEDPARWRETAHALAFEWQLHPQDTAPPRKLLDLFGQQGRQDGIAVTAAAMVLRDLGDQETTRIAEAHRPKTLQRIDRALPPDLLARAGYGPEESDLERLAELLVETGVLQPFERDELGLVASDLPLAVAEQPTAFRDVLWYVCGLYGVDLPEAVISLPVLGSDARLADLRPPALLCGNLLLASEDSVELGFRLGRAMALWAPGRLAGSARSGGQMRPYFVAALALANATGAVQGADELAASHAIAGLNSSARARISQAALAIKQNYDNLNLTVWGRGLARIATRLALIISGDLVRVGRAVAEEDGPAALDDLIAFALSLDYLDLRRDLGFLAG
jgi:CheY-like chemotaxis protein/tetratricopeptide (TPR) repeat protein